MTREEAIALMTCYTCGDLAPQVQRELDALVASDPELQDLARQLRDQNERVGQLIVLRTAPTTSRWADALRGPPAPEANPRPGAPSPEPPPTRTASLLGAALALAAAVILAVVLAWSLSPGDVPPASLAAVAHVHAQAMAGTLAAVDPESPGPGFDAGHVPDVVRMVPDLSHLGLRISGVYVLPGDPPGAGVEYTDGTHTYLCQMWVDLPLPRRAELESEVAGIRLHGFREGGVSLVVWSDGTFVCVMSSSVPLPELMAFVERRVAGTG